MDLANIREDLALVLQSVGFAAASYVPNDSQSFPAAFAGVPTDMVPRTTTKWVVTLPLTLLFNLADGQDAQRRLDVALSPGADNSVYDALLSATKTGLASWESCRWLSAGNVRAVTVGQAQALACDVNLEIMAGFGRPQQTFGDLMSWYQMFLAALGEWGVTLDLIHAELTT